MDILKVPFHQFLNIEKSDRQGFIFRLTEHPKLINHLGTIHACAQLTLAEATSGEFLLNEFYAIREKVIPVMRKTEVKYQKPGNGNLYSKATFSKIDKVSVYDDLNRKSKAIIPIKVEVFNEANERTLLAFFDWFIAIKEL